MRGWDYFTGYGRINAARAVAELTVTGHREKLGVVLRACEIRALAELGEVDLTVRGEVARACRNLTERAVTQASGVLLGTISAIPADRHEGDLFREGYRSAVAVPLIWPVAVCACEVAAAPSRTSTAASSPNFLMKSSP